jgi:hypothetical protein
LLGNTGKWGARKGGLLEDFGGVDGVRDGAWNPFGEEGRKSLLDIGSSPRKDAGTYEKQDFSKQYDRRAEGEKLCFFFVVHIIQAL